MQLCWLVCGEQPSRPLQKYTSDGQAVPEEQVVQNFMCALDLINLVYEVGGAAAVLDGWSCCRVRWAGLLPC